MLKASAYPVTFSYGATTAPYSPASPHRGDDHKAPAGTHIDVGDKIIGLVGSTGKSSGPHVHIQKVSGGAVRNPNGAGLGNSIAFPATIYETGNKTDIGKYVRLRDAEGTLWSYFHMSEIRVSNGTVIQKDTHEMIANADQATKIYKMLRPNGNPSEAEINATAGKRSFEEFLNSAQAEISNRDANLRHQAEQANAMQNTIVEMQRTIMELHSQDTASKQKYDAAINEISKLTDELKATNNKIVELQNVPEPTTKEPGWFTKLLVKIFAKK